MVFAGGKEVIIQLRKAWQSHNIFIKQRLSPFQLRNLLLEIRLHTMKIKHPNYRITILKFER